MLKNEVEQLKSENQRLRAGDAPRQERHKVLTLGLWTVASCGGSSTVCHFRFTMRGDTTVELVNQS